jgi:hypothetical protein
MFYDDFLRVSQPQSIDVQRFEEFSTMALVTVLFWVWFESF